MKHIIFNSNLKKKIHTIENDKFSTSDSSKTPGLNNFVETQEQYYNRIYGEA